KTVIWDHVQKNRALFGFDGDIRSRTGQPLGAQLMEEGLGALRGAIGTPDQIRVLLKGYADAGVDQVIFVSQSGNNRHEHICESLELFAEQVMPEFHEGEEAREKDKVERLAPAVEA